MLETINEENAFIIYSDGACSGNPGRGGWASILITPDKMIQELSGAHPSTTNNRMEMTAALEALLKIPSGSKVIVLTDSSYLIRGITQWVFGWMKRGWKNAEGNEVLNKEIWEKLVFATKGKKIEWRYIPGHKGFAGNERVDKIAVARSLGESPFLFNGPLADYSYSILPLPEKFPIPEMKRNNQNNSKEAQKSFYLSYINGILERHDSWDKCQSKVKGVSQARFKKVTSKEEAESVIKGWGLDPKLLDN